MTGKTDFEIICAFILLKAAIKVAEQKNDSAMVLMLNKALPTIEFAFNQIIERQKPNSRRRNWISGFVDGGNYIGKLPENITTGEKIITKEEFTRLFKGGTINDKLP